MDCDIAEEKWGGKKKKQKGVYFKAPKTLPKPKTKKKGKNEPPKRNVKRALHWGEQLTCPKVLWIFTIPARLTTCLSLLTFSLTLSSYVNGSQQMIPYGPV